MCGIAGICSQHGLSTVKEMCGAMIHRGPDDEAYFSDTGISLGMRRLSVIDLSKNIYPISNEEQTLWLVFNGEIYNYKALRRKLSNHKFKTDCDAEVIVHLYEEHGIDFPNFLEGMFAVALWDCKKQRLVLVRDRFGEKPLYYSVYAENFRFASSIGALEASLIDMKPNSNAIRDFLYCGFVPSPHTAFENIRKVAPSEMVIVDYGQVSYVGPYWWLGSKDGKIRHLLKTSVQSRMLADVPVGVFLSGGIDSSTVVALAKRKRLKTFSVGFRNEDDELTHAKKVAKHFSTDHHEVMLDTSSIEVYPEIVKHYGDLVNDLAGVPVYFLAKEAKKKVKVVLTGDGGDEVFAGYPIYRNSFRRIIRLWELYKVKRFPFLSKKDGCRQMQEHHLFNRLSEQFLMKTDKMTMAHSIEARTPYLNHNLVESVIGLPESKKISKNSEKLSLRRAMKGLIPEKTRRRRKKNFTTPKSLWLKHPTILNHLADRRLWPYCESWEIKKLLESKSYLAEKKLWGLVTLSCWFDVYG